MKAIIIIAQGLEECEALLTYDLLYRAGINVDLLGLEDEITSSHNVTIKAHININDVDYTSYDCLILPGGIPGTYNLEKNQKVQEIIDYFVANDKYVCAICAAPSILIHKGLLQNNKFICYPGFESGLTAADSKTYQDNKFITAKGLGAAFEFSHLIITNLINKEKADEVLQKTQY